MSRRSRPFGFLIKLVVILLLAGGLVAVSVPPLVGRWVKEGLNEHSQGLFAVGDVRIRLTAPQLVMTNVSFMNPPGFVQQTALQLERVTVVMDDFLLREPYHIHSVTIEQSSGHAVTQGATNNFVALQAVLQDMSFVSYAPKWLSKPVVIDVVTFRQARVQFGVDPSNVSVLIPDANAGPFGNAAAPVTLDQALRGVMMAALQHHAQGLPKLAVEKFKTDTKNVVDKIGSMIDQLIAPAPQQPQQK